MRPNAGYAKNLAVYNVTVVSCRHGYGHDQDIYLSHCWNPDCFVIIDSRANGVRVEGYYLCLKCGSGPEDSHSFTQGDVCPNCGEREMTAETGSLKSCRAFRHQITLPRERYLTGRATGMSTGRRRTGNGDLF